jgi:hypothetical protein
MSEPIWTTIQVRCPASWNGPEREYHGYRDVSPPAPFAAIADYLSEMDSNWDPEACLWIFQGEANYGMAADAVTEFLDWCEAHKVPYRANDDTKYEFAGETRIYDPHTDEVTSFGNDGDTGTIVMHLSTWEGIRAAHTTEAGHLTQGAIHAVAEHFARDVDICSISIDHLPAECPQDEEVTT